jgi:hypothetical protein
MGYANKIWVLFRPFRCEAAQSAPYHVTMMPYPPSDTR